MSMEANDNEYHLKQALGDSYMQNKKIYTLFLIQLGPPLISHPKDQKRDSRTGMSPIWIQKGTSCPQILKRDF